MAGMHVAPESARTTPRRVAIVRHGKAESGDEGSDHARRLTSRGRADAAATGRWLAGQVARVDLAWVSSAVRATATWEAMAAALPQVGVVVVERELYLAGPREVLDRVLGSDEVPVLVVVAHNPTLEQVVRALTGELHGLRPGAGALIELSAGGPARLLDLHQPGS